MNLHTAKTELKGRGPRVGARELAVETAVVVCLSINLVGVFACHIPAEPGVFAAFRSSCGKYPLLSPSCNITRILASRQRFAVIILS